MTRAKSFDLAAAQSTRFRSVEVPGLLPDGGSAIVHFRAPNGHDMIDAVRMKEDTSLTEEQKVQKSVRMLSERLLTEDGAPLATEDQLFELPIDTLLKLLTLVNGGDVSGGPVGNVSTGEPETSSASPTD